MNIILKLGASALTVSLAITAAGCVKSGASTTTAGATAAGDPSGNSATALPSPYPYQNVEDKMPRVKVEDAKKLIEEGKAIIIDVRGAEAYKISHVKGALDVPLNKLEAGDFKDLPTDKTLIAYCG